MEEVLDYIIFLIVYIIVDMAWVLGARKLHSDTVQLVQNAPITINFVPVLFYYMIAPLAYVFIIKRYSKSTSEALGLAALVGLLMFGAFDFTNKAIFKNYPWSYTIMDIVWGVSSMCVTTAICLKLKN